MDLIGRTAKPLTLLMSSPVHQDNAWGYRKTPKRYWSQAVQADQCCAETGTAHDQVNAIDQFACSLLYPLRTFCQFRS